MSDRRITILGSGTSYGVPTIGCECRVCTSEDPFNHRTRVSIMVESAATRLIVDTSVDFRMQMVRARVQEIDAVLYTHSHADHLHGLDDIRPLSQNKRARVNPIPCYGFPETLRDISTRFAYIFKTDHGYSNKPQIELVPFPSAEFIVGDIPVRVVKVLHGGMPVAAFRFWDSALYATDLNVIPEESSGQFEKLDLLILGAPLRTRHPTHFSIPEGLQVLEKYRPNRAYLTHLSHQVEHHEFSEELASFALHKGLGGVFPAHDGLQIDLGAPT